MKILLATFWYLPHVGGVDTYLKVLKQGLEERGHQVELLAHHPSRSEIYQPLSWKTIEKKRFSILSMS